MRELWANGEHYRSYHAFLKAIHVDPGKIRSMQDALAEALKLGTPFWYGAKGYDVSDIPPERRQKRLPRPEPRAYIESRDEAPRPRGLLARGHATCGLHQDRGEHWA